MSSTTESYSNAHHHHRRTTSNVIPASTVASPSRRASVVHDANSRPDTADDVTVADICVHGLPLLLRSRLPLCYFLRFLLEEHSCENLICFLEIEHYEALEYDATLERKPSAVQILDVYLSPRSPFEVNVTERAHDQCRSAIYSDDPVQLAECFSTVKPAVYQLLMDAYTRFTRSDWWRSMSYQLDGKSVYTAEDRIVTVSHLTGYLQRLHQHDLVHAPERAILFRELITDFCRTVVGLEIIHTTVVRNDVYGDGTPMIPLAMPPNYPHTLIHRSSQDSNSDKSMRKMKSNPLMKLRNGLRKLA